MALALGASVKAWRNANRRDRSYWRRDGLLAVGELAVFLVLLIAAGLLIKSFRGIWRIHPGFGAENVLTLQLSLSGKDYHSPAGRLSLLSRVTERFSPLPGVKAVGWTDFMPANGARSWAFYPQGQPKPTPDAAPSANVVGVNPGYLEALAIPLKRGRFILERDDDPQSPPVAVINETLTRQQWESRNPAGKRIFFCNENWATVVGVNFIG